MKILQIDFLSSHPFSGVKKSEEVKKICKIADLIWSDMHKLASNIWIRTKNVLAMHGGLGQGRVTVLVA